MALEPGSKAGPYVIEAQLGRGGMASVYLAHDASLNRKVALKVLPREFLHDPDFVGRFRIEAQAVASLEHPNVIPIYAYDVDQERGIPWMAMRYVPGGALSSLLKKEKLSHARVVQILRGVADALDYAHAKKAVHRDVKPQNILLDDAGRVYLADFGVVKMLETPSGLTATGMITGTPQYMSPEQATATKVDHRADIYALGIVAYEMFTGKVPFTADTPVAILMKHVQEPIPPPPPALVPEPLTRALLKATAKAPADRWPTAGAFAEALEAGLRAGADTVKEPVTVDVTRVSVPTVGEPRAAAPKPASSWMRGCITFVLRLGMAAMLGVGAALAALIWLGREPPPPPEATSSPSAPESAGAAAVPPLPASLPPVTAPEETPPRSAETHPPASLAPPTLPPATARAAPTREPPAPAPPTPVAATPEPPRPPSVSPVVQGLVQSLGASDGATRWRAAEALGTLGAEAQPAVPALTGALHDRSADVRWRAAEALGKIGAEAASAVPSLATLLRDSDELVRGEAAKALGRLGPASESAVPALAEALKHSQVALRREAAKALVRIGPRAREAVPALTAALTDKDKFVRMESARALGSVGEGARPALPALQKAARDPEMLVSRQAREALRKLGAE